MTDSKVAAALRDLRRELGESCPEECCAAACWNCYLCADCAPKWAAVEAYGEACREAGAEEKMMIYVCNDEKCGVIDHFTKHGVRYHRLLETELPPAMCGRHDGEVFDAKECPGCAIEAAARLAGIEEGEQRTWNRVQAAMRPNTSGEWPDKEMALRWIGEEIKRVNAARAARLRKEAERDA